MTYTILNLSNTKLREFVRTRIRDGCSNEIGLVLKWIGRKNLAQAWAECQDQMWMEWFLCDLEHWAWKRDPNSPLLEHDFWFQTPDILRAHFKISHRYYRGTI